MRSRIILFLVVIGFTAGCRSATSSSEIKAMSENVRLPEFKALDSVGTQIDSSQINERVVLAAFFDQDSVLAWRTLAVLERKSQSQKNKGLFLIGIASSRFESAGLTDLNSLKKEYQISFPIIPDNEKRLSQAFHLPNCCDSLNLYDKQGTLKASMNLSESYNKLDSLVAESRGAGSGMEQPSQSAGAEILSRLKIIRQGGAPESLPVASQGLTVVNLFDEFTTECLTGDRFQTLNRLNQLPHPITKVLVVFSEKTFSIEDVENFKMIFSMPDLLVQGDMEAVKPYLIKGTLLVVFDSDKNLIWQEKPGMTEKEVLVDVSRLTQSSTN